MEMCSATLTVCLLLLPLPVNLATNPALMTVLCPSGPGGQIVQKRVADLLGIKHDSAISLPLVPHAHTLTLI